MWANADNILNDRGIDFSIWDVQYHSNTGRFRVKKKTEFNNEWQYFDSIDYILMLVLG